MPTWLPRALLIAQDVISVFIIILVLIQSKGSGVSAVFGGGEGNAYRTRRGAERVIFIVTIVLVGLWFATAISSLLVRR